MAATQRFLAEEERKTRFFASHQKNISKNLEKLLRAHAVSLAYEMMVGLFKNRRGSI